MNIIQCFLANNDCYKTNRTIKPRGVMIHSTGANNPSLKRYVQPNVGGIGVNRNNNSWNMAGVKKCVHAFIGKLENGTVATAQTLPWNHRGWHCGSGNKGSGNDTHISFEICEDGLTDKTYFNKVYQEAVELTAFLCKEYSLDPLADGVVICHKEGCLRGIASNHADVLHWFPKHGKDMDDFRADVARQMGITTQTATTFEAYKVKITASDLNVRAGAGTSYKVNTVVKKGEVYTIVDEENGWGKLKSGAGWISLAYTQKI